MFKRKFEYVQVSGSTASFDAGVLSMGEQAFFYLTVNAQGGFQGHLSMTAAVATRSLSIVRIDCTPAGNFHGTLLLKVGIDFLLEIPSLSAGVGKVMASDVLSTAIGFYLKSGFRPSAAERSQFYQAVEVSQLTTGEFLDAQLLWARLPRSSVHNGVQGCSRFSWEADMHVVRSVCWSKLSAAGWQESGVAAES